MNRSDNFNRADSNSAIGSPSDGLGAYTTSNAVWGISSNKAYNFLTDDSIQMAYFDVGSDDVEISVDMSGVSSSRSPANLGRYSDGSNFWYVHVYGDANLVRLYKQEAASPSIVGSNGSVTVADGDTWKLVMSGNTINVYQNGVLRIGPITDSFNSTATKHGIMTDGKNAGNRWDNLLITDLNFVETPPADLVFGGAGTGVTLRNDSLGGNFKVSATRVSKCHRISYKKAG